MVWHLAERHPLLSGMCMRAEQRMPHPALLWHGNHHETGNAGGTYAQQEIAKVAEILSEYQPVTVCANPDQVHLNPAERLIGSSCSLFSLFYRARR